MPKSAEEYKQWELDFLAKLGEAEAKWRLLEDNAIQAQPIKVNNTDVYGGTRGYTASRHSRYDWQIDLPYAPIRANTIATWG